MTPQDIEERMQKLNQIIATYEQQLAVLVQERDQFISEFRDALKTARVAELHEVIKGPNGTGTTQTNR